jgi:hypothetical protein
MLLVHYAEKSNKIFNLFPAPRQDSDLESLSEGLDPDTLNQFSRPDLSWFLVGNSLEQGGEGTLIQVLHLSV